MVVRRLSVSVQSRQRGGDGPFEKLRGEAGELVTLGTYHFLESPMELDSCGPRTFAAERNARSEGWQRRVNSINVLRIQSHQSTVNSE